MIAAEIAAWWLTPGAWGAQTITLSVSLTLQPSGVSGVSKTTRTSGTLAIPTNYALYFQGLQTISTASRQLVATGNVAPLGYCLLHNCDDVNFVTLYSDVSASSALVQIDPGGYAVIPLAPAATIYAKSDTASIALETYFTAR